MEMFFLNLLYITFGLITLPLQIGWLALDPLSLATQEVEVRKLASSDENIFATLMEINGGATTAYGYRIYLESGDLLDFCFKKEIAFLYAATRNLCASGADLQWTSDNTILIKYLSARFTRVPAETVEFCGKTITVKLVPNTVTPEATCGAMESSR